MAFTRFVTAAVRQRPIEVLGDGTQSRDFTYVSDAVAATIAALGSEPNVYNVGGGEVASINAVIDMIAEIVGGRVDRVTAATARGDVAHTWADTERARERLGWAPTQSLRSGLTEQVRWVRSLADQGNLQDVLVVETGLE
jgi:nucleoside-diphosphate-sugar epimerase